LITSAPSPYDDQDPLELVDAVDRADVDAREVFDVDAGLGDDVRH
jgi:hypothetical protein